MTETAHPATRTGHPRDALTELTIAQAADSIACGDLSPVT